MIQHYFQQYLHSISLNQWIMIIPSAALLIVVWSMTNKGQPIKPKIFWLIIIIQILYTGLSIAYFIRLLSLSGFSRHLLNYHNDYFSGQIFFFVQTLLAGWIAAVVLGGLAYVVFIRLGREELFDRRDIWLAVIGAAVVGWPAVLLFLALAFAMAVVAMIGLVLLRRKTLSDRLIVSPFILPAAMITLFVGPYLLQLTHLDKIRF